jgi:hypothetical protein
MRLAGTSAVGPDTAIDLAVGTLLARASGLTSRIAGAVAWLSELE